MIFFHDIEILISKVKGINTEFLKFILQVYFAFKFFKKIQFNESSEKIFIKGKIGNTWMIVNDTINP